MSVRICLSTNTMGYDYHCRAARALAEEYFDAGKAAKNVLEVAL